MERAITRKSVAQQHRHHNQQQQVEVVAHEGKKGKRSRKAKGAISKGDNIKVVYISTPMKVKTSASRFRQVVQELTGIDSDVARIMESADGGNIINDRDALGEGNEGIDDSSRRANRTVEGGTDQMRRRHREDGVIAGLGFSLDGDVDLSGLSSDSTGNYYEPFDRRLHLDNCKVMEEGLLGVFDECLLYDSNNQLDGLESFLL